MSVYISIIDSLAGDQNYKQFLLFDWAFLNCKAMLGQVYDYLVSIPYNECHDCKTVLAHIYYIIAMFNWL